MTSREKRTARWLERRGAQADGADLDRGTGPEFSDTARGRRALDRWAKRYDERNGAPESDGDR